MNKVSSRMFLRRRIEGCQAGPCTDVRAVHARVKGQTVTLVILGESSELVLTVSPEVAARLGAQLVQKGVELCR